LGLHDVLSWQVGTHISLNVTAQSKIKLLCGDMHMFSGMIGQRGNRLAVRVEERLIKDDRRE
jgi:flagellar motor switch protein FliM